MKVLVVKLRFKKAWWKSRLRQHMEFSHMTAALKNSTFHSEMIFPSYEKWDFLWIRNVEFRLWFCTFPFSGEGHCNPALLMFELVRDLVFITSEHLMDSS